MKPLFSTLALVALTTPAAADGFASATVESGVISTKKSEFNLHLSDNGDMRVFTRAEADYALGKILLSHGENGAWTAPAKIVFSDARYKDSDPWLSGGGDTIYFISNRPARAGESKDAEDYDIWRTRRAGDIWLAPERVSGVNSDAPEFGPEVHGDYLYFSSTRTGGYEIYRTRLNHKSVGDLERLSAPINSEAADSDFTQSPNGRVAVWCSDRAGGFGGCDLYVSRASDDGWTAAVNLGPSVNTGASEFTPAFSPNGARLYFASKREVAGQDKGAADIYEIPVAKTPALQAAMSAAALEQLRTAFGGTSNLLSAGSLSFTLETRSAGGESATRADYIYDFAREAIMRRETRNGSTETVFVRRSKGVRIKDGVSTGIDAAGRKALQDAMHVNFLYFLTNRNVAMSGPFDIAGHGNLQWYRLSVGGVASPVLGLEPHTGRIVKVLGEDAVYALETDYLPTDGGLIAPHRYIVMQQGEKSGEGLFHDLRVNQPFPEDAPDWVTD